MSDVIWLYIFEGDEVKKFPMARWNRINKGEESWPEKANSAVRYAYCLVTLLNGKPVAAYPLEYDIEWFDDSGNIDEKKRQATLSLAVEQVGWFATQKQTNVTSYKWVPSKKQQEALRRELLSKIK